MIDFFRIPLFLTFLVCGLQVIAEGPADRIFLGSNILTMDDQLGTPELVAIKNDRIIAVGNRDELDRWLGPDTQVMELGGKALLPGFIDAHGHFSGIAVYSSLANLSSPPVGPVTSISDLQTRLKNYIANKEMINGEWVFGYGYDESLLAESRHPTRNDLDQVSTDHPIGLIHVSGHLAASNSTALHILGLDKATPDPAGGRIRRDRQGRPNGVLEETATSGIRQHLYKQSPGSIDAFANAFQIYASQGITTVQDGAVPLELIHAMQSATEKSAFPLDLVAYQLVTPELPASTVPFSQSYVNGFRIGGVKLMLDGSPQGKTAYLTHAYHIAPDGQAADYRGYPNLEASALNRIAKTFLDQQIPILAHANGDAASDMLIEAVSLAKPQHDHRTVMIHAQTLREDQLDAMAELGMIPSFFSAHTYFWGDWHRDSVLGPERASRISPTRSALARDIPFTVHNDTPIIPPDIRRLIWATVNRETRSGQILGPDQRVSALAAIRAVTINAARQYFEEDFKGSITPGKQADLVILSENPLHIHPDHLKDLQIIETIARGKTVYISGSAGL